MAPAEVLRRLDSNAQTVLDAAEVACRLRSTAAVRYRVRPAGHGRVGPILPGALPVLYAEAA